MPNEYQLTKLEISLPVELLETLKGMARQEGKPLNAKIVSLLDLAVFISPEDLAMIKDKDLRRAELVQLEKDEDEMVAKYHEIIAEIQKAANMLDMLKK
jgi:predicted RecB family endonuclease